MKRILVSLYYLAIIVGLAWFWQANKINYRPVTGIIHYTNPETKGKTDIRVSEFLQPTKDFYIRFMDYEGVVWGMTKDGVLKMENPRLIDRLRLLLGIRQMP